MLWTYQKLFKGCALDVENPTESPFPVDDFYGGNCLGLS